MRFQSSHKSSHKSFASKLVEKFVAIIEKRNPNYFGCATTRK